MSRKVSQAIIWHAAIATVAVACGGVSGKHHPAVHGLLVPLSQLRPTAAVCEVHHVPLEEVTVEVVSGDPMMGGTDYQQARASLFPHACWAVSGEGRWKPEQTMAVKQCPLCTEAEVTWLTQHLSETELSWFTER